MLPDCEKNRSNFLRQKVTFRVEQDKSALCSNNNAWNKKRHVRNVQISDDNAADWTTPDTQPLETYFVLLYKFLIRFRRQVNNLPHKPGLWWFLRSRPRTTEEKKLNKWARCDVTPMTCCSQKLRRASREKKKPQSYIFFIVTVRNLPSALCIEEPLSRRVSAAN